MQNFSAQLSDNDIDNMRTPKFLEHVLDSYFNKLKNNFSIESNDTSLIGEAQDLENFLNMVAETGKYQCINNNEKEGWANEAIRTRRMNLLRKHINTEEFQGNKDDRTNTALENWLSNLTTGILSNMIEGGLKKNNSTSTIGTARIDIFHNLKSQNYVKNGTTIELNKDAVREEMKNAYLSVSKKIKDDVEDINNELNKKGVAINSKVSGKVDTMCTEGPSMKIKFLAEIEEDKQLAQAMETLITSSFTDKGYKTNKSIHLGNTNLFRVFNSACDHIDWGESKRRVIDKWMRFSNCILHEDNNHEKEKGHNNIYNTIYQIRYIYELTGLGSHYVETLIEEAFQSAGGAAKFLIFYSKGKDQFRVMPTYTIIKELKNSMGNNNNNNNNNTIKTISRKQALDQSITLKVSYSRKGNVKFFYEN